MALLTGELLSLQSRLAGFETCFCFGGARLCHGDGVNFRLFLPEILHQRNVARADPGAGAALDAVGNIVCSRFIVQLAFTVPVQLLWQQIGRTGIGTGAAANAALLILRFAHFTGGRGKQTVGYLNDRDIEPRQGKAHQRPAHDHHLIAARAEPCVIQKVSHRGAEASPDVPRPGNRLTGQGDHAFGQGLTVDNRTLHRISGTDVLHQYADIGGATAVGHLFTGQDLG